MARKKKHEDHANHEAWAIPYGDLITLLLAFFVVMYAISSVNEGKFRVLSDSLQAAFRGTPKTLEPLQVGEKQRGSGADIAVSIVQQAMIDGQPRQMLEAVSVTTDDGTGAGPARQNGVAQRETSRNEIPAELARVADEVEKSLRELIDADLVAVRRHAFWIEVEIRTDILFPSGVATLNSSAMPALEALSTTLARYPNPIRVEGHTDNIPIRNSLFPSNWELSAARAASVVHKFARGGIQPARLAVIGLGEYRPTQSNDTAAGRNANRRVLIVILSGDDVPEGGFGAPDAIPDAERALPGESAAPALSSTIQSPAEALASGNSAPPATIPAATAPAAPKALVAR